MPLSRTSVSLFSIPLALALAVVLLVPASALAKKPEAGQAAGKLQQRQQGGADNGALANLQQEQRELMALVAELERLLAALGQGGGNHKGGPPFIAGGIHLGMR